MKTNLTFLVAVVSVCLLTNCKKDNTPAPANKAPVADAGTDHTIILPLNYVQLVGSGTDSDGSIESYNWTKVAGGPAEGTIVSPNKAVTDVTSLVRGRYSFQLQVTDDRGLSTSDKVIVSVLSSADDPCLGCWDY